MEKNFTILIADRNRHVREFLKREMRAEGYRVKLAKSGREVLEWVYQYEPLDLLILDLDLPDWSGPAILEKIGDRIPTLPVVIHTLLFEHAHDPALANIAGFVEKRGNSVENLKRVVFEILNRHSPHTPCVSDSRGQDSAKH